MEEHPHLYRPGPALTAPAPLASLAALWAYEGQAAALVAGLKRANDRRALSWIADGMAGLVPPGVEVCTWAPTSRRHAGRRGFDHARLLALAVGRRAGLPVVGLLQRADERAQTGRSRADRLADGPAFSARFALDGAAVLVIDDVTTTGATLRAAGHALVAAQGGRIAGLVAAATR